MFSTKSALKVTAGVTIATLSIALTAGFVPVPDTASAAERAAGFTARLQPAGDVVKVVAADEMPFGERVTAHQRTATYVPAPVPAPVRTTSVRRTSTVRTAKSAGGSSEPAAEPAGDGDPQAVLNRYIAKYPILAGCTASYGDAKGYQAIAYYKSGRIVVSSTHTRSLETIIAHEIWHVIDWRDNGVIDWGENVPPK